jgi:hypothetical protein
MCDEFVKLFKRQERRHAWGINKQISYKLVGNSIMLTIFAIPKPFQGHIGVIQRNAIRSWLELRQACEIILLGDDEGTAEVAKELKVQHVPKVERNEQGTPLVNSVFFEAQAVATYPLLCYVNADIVLMSDFLPAVQAVCNEIGQALMVGRRWDVEIKERLEFTIGWEKRLKNTMLIRGKRQVPSAIDYFVFTKGLFGEIPPFAIGRPKWDNWMLYRARSKNIAIVDLSRRVEVVHQNHDYSHHPDGDRVWESQEARKNKDLAGGQMHLHTILDAQYYLTKSRIQRRRVYLYGLYRFLLYLSEKHAAFKPVVTLIRRFRDTWCCRGNLVYSRNIR